MSKTVLIALVSAIVVALERDDTDSLVVKIESGPVRGYRHQEVNVFEFLDIPYATAPSGVNKFGPPLEAPTWFGIWEAVESGIVCPQPSVVNSNLTMDENCLVASVFVPDNTIRKLPVVVYIHGGGFQYGYGNWLKPIDLVSEHNIVAVTFNYRLGVHGFLCLGTEDIPGNAAMKDQMALLRWVQKNIANFGGNPDDVTIAGYSAGAASVDLLMISKSAAGLFHKVIPESGPNMAAFAVQSDPLETAKWFAKIALNFDNVDDIDALAQIYKTATYDQLTYDPYFDIPESTYYFSPCVERPLSNRDRANDKEVFLDESPFEILKKGNYTKVPLLYGFSSMEGLLRIENFDSWKTKMNENFSIFLPGDLKFQSEAERENVANKIKEYYFGEKPVNEKTILEYINYFSDSIFKYPSLKSVKMHLENGHRQIYLYEFSYVDEQTPLVPHTNIRGATHCAQTIALFSGLQFNGGTLNQTDKYKKISTIMRQLWANFIKTGKPVPEGSEDLPSWPAVSSNWSPHMSLGNEIELKGSLLLERTLFWEDIYNMYYKEPVPPSILFRHT